MKIKSVAKEHITFMNVAEEIAALSKCQSIQVCALFVRDNRIISTGVNGSPSGFKNCSDVFPNGLNTEEDKINHYRWQQINEIHAEENAILYAAKNNICLKDCVLYVTYKPCFKCTKMLVTLGIKTVYYKHYYMDSIFRDDVKAKQNIESFIRNNGIEFIDIKIGRYDDN